jgi:hypothetical protein
MVDGEKRPALDMPDWWLLTHPSRPNGLLIGSALELGAILDALRPSLRHPILRWPESPAPWARPRAVGTLILQDVFALTEDDCESLLTWMDGPGAGVQVVSLASRPVYPLVEERAFPEPLYYRLNQVCVDCSAATAA